MGGDGDERRWSGAEPAFVGRERELAEIGRALAAPPAVVLVAAEPGAGKSRLVQEFLRSRAARGHRMLVATCPPFQEALTLGPIVEALRLTRRDLSGLRLSPLAGALRPLVPEWATQLPPAPEPPEDATAARHRLFRALAELVGAFGVTGLVVEDVHWADPVTLEFLLFLATRRQADRPNLMATYRPADLPAASLLLRLSSRAMAGTTLVRIVLAPLDPSGTAAMVSSMLDGGAVSGELVSFLHDRTGGLPLAVEESVRLLGDRADLVQRAGEWVRPHPAELPVSPTLRDSVLERVLRLNRPAQDVLRAAAVLAEAADARVVSGVAGQAGSRAVGEAVGSGLVREDDRLRLSFRHAFMGQVVYESIPGAERRRLHRLAGKVLEAGGPPAAVALTRHFREAGEAGPWARYAEESAARAVAAGDRTSAAVVLQELLATAELATPLRVRLTRQLAQTALARREPVDDLHRRVVATIRSVLATAAAAGTAEPDLAAIRTLLGRLLVQQGDLGVAHAELERAIPHLPPDSVEAARAMTYLGWPWLGPWPAAVHRQWLERAAAVDKGAMSLRERLSLASDRATALLQLGDEAGWELAAELPTDADSPEVGRLLARTCLNIGFAAIIWGRYDDARSRLDAGLAMADAERYPRLTSKLEIAQADLAWFTGAWDGLDRFAGALLDAEDVEPMVHLSATRLAGRLHAVQGAPRRAEECFRTALRVAGRLGATEEALEPAAALARLRLARGRTGEALRLTQQPIEPMTAKGIWVLATEIAPVRVEALVAAGRLAEAADLVAGYADGLQARDAPAPLAALATCRGILARGQGRPAARLFARAAAAWDRLPRPYDALRAREQQASCLLASDRPGGGVALLTEVWRSLSVLGASGDAARVGRLLHGHGVDVRRAPRGGRRGYGSQPSPRELEVVQLVLAGRTNREIARILCKSPRTVAGQLASVMRKLRVSSRTELAVRAVDAGLVPEGGGATGSRG